MLLNAAVRVSALFTVVSATACTPGFQPAEGGIRSTSEGVVLDRAIFEDASGSVLDVLRQRIGTMQIRTTSYCPEITLRSRKSIVGSPSPQVYVDGTPATNTCILSSLSVVNVERVEVYNGARSPRPGYHGDPNGLILVFMRRQ